METAGFADATAASGLLAEFREAESVAPRIAGALRQLPDPDRTLLRLRRLVGERDPREWLAGLDDLARLLALAPGLADTLLARPELLAGLLAGNLAAKPLDAALAGASGGDAVADCRQWLNAARLDLGVAILAGTLHPADAGARYSALAEAAVAGLLRAVEAEFRAAHGVVGETRFAVLGLGKLGGREMTFGSDLDLILVYDAADLRAPSSGPGRLGAQVYFARLANALLAALTARRGAETLYEIDVRLSPWARKSAATVHLEGLCRYYAEDAWTWELMALTRARPVAGEASLRDELARFVRQVLERPREPARLAGEVDDMRRRIARHHTPEPPFDAKHRPGGTVDCEFVLQYLMLREAARQPEVLTAASAEAVERLCAAGVLDAAEAADLAAGLRLWTALTCLGRLTEGVGDEAWRRREILRLAGADDAAVEATAGRVRAVYERRVAALAG